MTSSPAATLPTRGSRTVGWWIRSVAMVALPAAIGWIASRHSNGGMGVVVGLLAFVGAIYVFHPDTLGWKLSLSGRMVDGPDPGPSHFWQVWARLSGLLLLVVCAAGALLYSPPRPDTNSCVISKSGELQCGPAPSASP